MTHDPIRAALDAAPAPAGGPPPTRRQLMMLAEEMGWGEDDLADATEYGLAVLARFGVAPAPERQQPRPVPVAERLPTAEDCDAEGRCWWLTWYEEEDSPHIPGSQWVFSSRSWRDTHWLPATALPLPEADA